MTTTYITIDLETTGLDMNKHGICQIGAVATGESFADFKGYFVSDVNPHRGPKQKVAIDPKALEVNGFDELRISSAPPIAEVIYAFYHFIHRWLRNDDHEVIITGHNVPFDVAWLIKEFRVAGMSDKVFRRVIDTVSLGYALYGAPLMSGEHLAAKNHMINRNSHDALSDAIVDAQVFHAMRRQLPGAQRSPVQNFQTILESFGLSGSQGQSLEGTKITLENLIA